MTCCCPNVARRNIGFGITDTSRFQKRRRQPCKKAPWEGTLEMAGTCVLNISRRGTTNAIERNIGDGTSNPLQVKPDRRRSNVRQTNESSKTDRTNDRNTAQLKFFFVFFALVTTNKLMFNTI
uniref:G protein-coupled receptor n=1 Tax=Panagrellus redivivus TaxID=6233 RepID=A0A7E4W450_PANRE